MTYREFTNEFRSEAVQLAMNSDLSLTQVADDLGVGKSTLSKWINVYLYDSGSVEPVLTESNELKLELQKLRKENRILREERDILKKATAFFASQK